MASDFLVLGPESSVIFYNLNKQFCNQKKVIITKEILLDSYETQEVRDLFTQLENSDKQSYFTILRENSSKIKSTEFISDLYKKIQDSIDSIYENLSDVKLKDYNFMSSVSNAKFTVTLRTPQTSFSKYYVEKGAIMTSIKNLIREHLESDFNLFNPSKVSNFHVEIYESYEVYKNIYLKKDADSLILSTSFGFPKGSPFDYQLGPELYYSRGEDFKFFQNNQSTAVFRDHTKIDEVEINYQEKILQNEDLVLVNNSTRNINDVLIEAQINKKGQFKIINVSLLENSITYGNDKGFIINKSSKNYDRVSILTLRDNYYEETPNPKYLLVRNQEEVNEVMFQLSIINYFDGVIFNTNFYSPVLDRIGSLNDIDIIYFSEKLQKGLDISINLSELSIEGAVTKSSENPFSKIINEENKEREDFLERLKNIDLSTPSSNPQSSQNNDITNIAEGIISSPNSSTSRPSSGSRGSGGSMYAGASSGSGKGAIGMLAQSVINNDNKPLKEETQVEQIQKNQEQVSEEYKEIPEQQPQAQTQSSEQMGDFFSQSNDNNQQSQPSSSNEFGGFANAFGESKAQTQSQPQPQQVSQSTNQVNNSNSSYDTSKYDDILSTEIITTPNINSGKYFVDMESLSQVNNGEINLLVTSPQEIGNPQINYIMPVSLAKSNSYPNCSLLINNSEDYFVVSENAKGYYVNLTQIDPSLKVQFLKESIRRFNNISLIIFKEDIDLLEKYLYGINSVFVKNLETNEDYADVIQKIKNFEKRSLMKKQQLY